MPPHTPLYIVVGAGVIGLTTALELKQRHPNARIIISAKHTPGDISIDYASPWAGANWFSAATDNGRQESWDAVAFRKFIDLADNVVESGVVKMDVSAYFSSSIENAGIQSQGTGKVWYEELVGGFRDIPKEDLPEEAQFGYTFGTVMIDVPIYLSWLQISALKAGVEIRRVFYDDIRDVLRDFPEADAVFNCTGLGSYHLKGVEDKSLYPCRGQTVLVQSPKIPLTKMYLQTPTRVDSNTTYIFPRGKYGGVILGGSRFDGVWNGDVDMEFAEGIMRRCCKLCPELGKPEDLKVIRHGVGLRPSRKGGARIEKEMIDGSLIIHNYGAAGTGYQASWGMAKNAVDLLD